MSEITLVPVAYKVVQSINSHTYFIKNFNLSGIFRWYVLCGTETFPMTFGAHPKFKDGFATPDETIIELSIYLNAENN
jgi:hypothetical protein